MLRARLRAARPLLHVRPRGLRPPPPRRPSSLPSVSSSFSSSFSLYFSSLSLSSFSRLPSSTGVPTLLRPRHRSPARPFASASSSSSSSSPAGRAGLLLRPVLVAAGVALGSFGAAAVVARDSQLQLSARRWLYSVLPTEAAVRLASQPGEAAVWAVIAANVAVFLLWQGRLRLPGSRFAFLDRLFMSHPTSGHGLPMLLNT